MYYILINEIPSYHEPKKENEYTQSTDVTSDWFGLDGPILEDNDNNKIIKINDKGIIVLYFYSGLPFYIEDYEENKVTNNKDLLELLQLYYKEGDKLIICGHSMGGGLAYLNVLEICDFINNKLINIPYSDIYVYTTGLGRIHTPLIDKFKIYHTSYKFIYVDIIYKNNDTIDGLLDGILIMSKSHTPNDPKSPFYSNNITNVNRNPDKKPLYSHNRGNYNTNYGDSIVKGWFETQGAYKTRVEDEKDKYNIRKDKDLNKLVNAGQVSIYRELKCWDNNWDELYSEKWNKCQELFDLIYSHNTVNSFTIDLNGSILKTSKNDIMKIYRLNDLSWDNGLPKYHRFIYYYRCLENM